METNKLARRVRGQQQPVSLPGAALQIGALVVGLCLGGLLRGRISEEPVMASAKPWEGFVMDGKKSSPVHHSVQTASGRISYTEQGTGPVALFVHGVLLNGYLWRHQLADLSDIRRCIAVDLLAHGDTEIGPNQRTQVCFDGFVAHLFGMFVRGPQGLR